MFPQSPILDTGIEFRKRYQTRTIILPPAVETAFEVADVAGFDTRWVG